MKNLIIASTLTLATTLAIATPRLNVYYGEGKPANLRGGRVAVELPWNKVWYKNSSINITGYWDIGVAYWRTDGNSMGNDKALTIFGVAPIFRFQLNPQDRSVVPFIDAGIGLAVHTRTRLASRDLGSNFAFQDLVAIGIAFGDRKQYEVAYQYMHFSNASLFPPNHGVDITSGIEFSYHMA